MVVSTPPRLDSRHTLRPGLTEFYPEDFQCRYLRGFAPVIPNFIRRTPSAATGIIVGASPPYPAAKKKRGFAPA